MSNVELDKDKIDRFWQGRTQVSDPRLATNYRDDGRLQIDLALVRRYATHESRVLDLGAGSCTLSGLLLPHVASIVAIDKYPGFLKHAPQQPNFITRCADVASFDSDEQYDLILLFGVVNFLTASESAKLYGRCQRMLRDGGKFIVKHQCGTNGELVVDKYSEELGTHYHARYPAYEQEFERLAECFRVELIDIYPPEINRWETTHFYAFVCQR